MSLGLSHRARLAAVPVAVFFALFSAFFSAFPADAVAVDEPFGAIVSSPSGGATVSGTSTLGAHASADASAGSFFVAGGAMRSAIEVAATHADGDLQNWTAAWNSGAVANGSYSITFHATRASDGAAASSPAVAFTVSNGAGPFTVTVTAPGNGATLTGTTVAMSATTSAAADTLTFILTPSGGGSVVTVGATGQEAGTLWTANWDSTAAPNGVYGFKARTFHGGTMDESDPRSVTVANAGGPAMTVTLDSPTAGSTASGMATLSATTSLVATNLAFVVRNGAGAIVATLPGTSGNGAAWTASWDSTAVPNGSFTARANATKDGTVTQSSIVSFTVSNAAPPQPAESVTVTLVAPTNGATVSGSVPLSASTSATPDTLVFIVTQAFGDHQATVIPATGAGTAWTATWPSGAAANGSYGVVARATKNGVESSSPVATVTLANAAPAPAAMTVTITSPSAGVTLSGTATLVASTSVAAGSLAFVVRDPAHPDTVVATASATGSATHTVWSATVNTATVTNGTYEIVARAIKEGVMTPSLPVAVGVSNAVAPNATPVEFSVTLPTAGATLSGAVVLSATANQALDGFTFTALGNGAGAAPITLPAVGNATKTVWNAAWDTKSVPNGDYGLTTVAVKSGAQTSGAPRGFKVSNSSVTVTITTPSNNAEVSGTKEVLVATVPGATSVAVKLTNTNNATITSTRNATFDAGRQVWAVSWNTLDFANGTYRIDAKAVDAQAHESIASPVTVRVANAAQAPSAFSVKVVAPIGGATVSGAAGLAAQVSGEAVSVQFFMSPTAGEIRRADAHFDANRKLWVASWATGENPNGAYAVGAVAINGSNAKAESVKVQVTVANAQTAPPPAPASFSVRLLQPAGGNVAGRVHFVAQTEGVIASVRFFVKLKGGTTQRELAGVPDATHVQWAADWDTAPEIVGTYELVAVAKNAAGAQTASGVVTMFIERIGETPLAPAPAPAPGTAPTETKPVIVILRPASDAVLHGSIGLLAGSPTAAKVRFAVRSADGHEVFAHDASRGDLGWSVLWNTATAPDGRYRVEASAFSAAGERMGGAAVGVAVANVAVPVSGPIETVPKEAVMEAVREVPPGTTPLPTSRLPQEAVDAGVKLDQECAAHGIPPIRCQAWLAERHQAAECHDAGIITKEECVAYLRAQHGGEVPACQGKTAQQCGEELARQTSGLLDAKELSDMKDTVLPHIGATLRIEPRVKLEESAGTAPVPGDGVGEASPPDMTNLMPFANRRRMAVRVHASPSFAETDDDTSHASMPAVLFVDSDGDALPDDLEKRLGTDPGDADTDDDGFDDGTEVSKGYNPLGKGRLADSGRSLAPIDIAIVSGAPIEQPKSAGVEREDLRVDEPGAPEEGSAGMVLRGRGRPGEVVTVFVYSYLPVVFTTTVKDDGTWEYDLGSELTDGQHEVYATVTDESGKIKDKSGVLSFFVSEAKAVGADEFFKPEDESPLASSKVQAPVRQLTFQYVLGGVALVGAALLLSYMLFMRPKKKGTLPPPPQ